MGRFALDWALDSSHVTFILKVISDYERDDAAMVRAAILASTDARKAAAAAAAARAAESARAFVARRSAKTRSRSGASWSASRSAGI